MERIEAEAERVLSGVPSYVWDGRTLPVPVEDIVDSCHGLLIRDMEDMSSAPGAPPLADGQTLSGLLLADRGEIWVNAAEAREWPPRRRFTIAHELGHWELHRAAETPVSVFCREASVAPEDGAADRPAPERPPLPPTEEEANAFAAALLMPAPLMREQYAVDRDFARLRDLFGTSGAAMGRRLHAVIRPAG